MSAIFCTLNREKEIFALKSEPESGASLRFGLRRVICLCGVKQIGKIKKKAGIRQKVVLLPVRGRFLRRPAPTMKLLKPTYLLRTLLLLCAVAVVSSACERNETQSLSDKLDHMIANRQVYDCQKEQRIAELRHLLSVSCLTPAQEYEINDRLFGEFHKYKLDSAIRYMERNVLLARRLGDRRKGCLSGIRLAELYSSTGMSIEAKRMLDSIDRRSVPRDMLATYYKAYNRFYQQYVAFSGQRHFRELEERYQDSVIMFADTVSVRYKLDRLYQMSRRNQSHEMEVRLLGFLNSLEPDSQLYAECAYSVGSFYRRRGDDWLARKYYMLSAMTDIRNSTKENAAFQALATLYYRHDDLFRAFRYTQAAVEDALFSNVQFRTVQMSELYSINLASHQAKESRTKHKLQYYLVLISVLSAGAGAAVRLPVQAASQGLPHQGGAFADQCEAGSAQRGAGREERAAVGLQCRQGAVHRAVLRPLLHVHRQNGRLPQVAQEAGPGPEVRRTQQTAQIDLDARGRARTNSTRISTPSS